LYKQVFNRLNQRQRASAECRSAEEFLSLAKEYDIALDQKRADELLEFIKNLSEDKLEKNTGGADDQSGMSGMSGGMSGLNGMGGGEGTK